MGANAYFRTSYVHPCPSMHSVILLKLHTTEFQTWLLCVACVSYVYRPSLMFHCISCMLLSVNLSASFPFGIINLLLLSRVSIPLFLYSFIYINSPLFRCSQAPGLSCCTSNVWRPSGGNTLAVELSSALSVATTALLIGGFLSRITLRCMSDSRPSLVRTLCRERQSGLEPNKSLSKNVKHDWTNEI